MPNLAWITHLTRRISPPPESRPRIRWAALALLLLFPWVLMGARGAADAMLVGVAVLFLVDCAVGRDWRRLLTPWSIVAALFWLWSLACSALHGGTGPIVQTLAASRFFVFVAALETWVLADKRSRQALHGMIILAALWVAGECWQQYLFGTNVFGQERFPDGALSGPFTRPRAGPIYLELFFPAFLPGLLTLSMQPKRAYRVLALLLLGLAVGTMVLIGQRMPTVLLAFGLCVTALIYKRFRLPVVLAIIAAGALLALTPILSPPTFQKLVLHFSDQMQHFWMTDYGMIFARSAAMVQAHPWFGLGWDGYRNHCMDAAYLIQPSWLPPGDPTSANGCTIHPHNYWMQIGTMAGLPGMVLFATLVGLWLWRIAGRGAYRYNGVLGAILVFAIMVFWPIASTTSLVTLPNAGFIFMMIGWGLAEAAGEAAATDGPMDQTKAA